MKIAIFDFDGTLSKKQSLPFMVNKWNELGYDKKKYKKLKAQIIFDFILYKSPFSKKFDKKSFRSKAMIMTLDLFKGMHIDDMIDFFDKCYQSFKETILEELISEVELCRKQGYKTVLLSGGYKPFIEIVGEDIGFDYVIGSPISLNEDGYINYNDPIKLSVGAQKTINVMELFKSQDVNWSESRAYADSYYDYDILSKVGNPVAVNPDNQLMDIAKDNKWKIMII